MRKGSQNRKPRLLVAGLGNFLLQDDGVGVHAVRMLQKKAPKGVLIVEVGTAVLDALRLFEWADKILAIDALQAGSPAGTIHLCPISKIEEKFLPVSLHELNLLGVMRFMSPRMTPDITVLGVEPEKIDYGLHLSPKVRSALPGLIDVTLDIMGHWENGFQLHFPRLHSSSKGATMTPFPAIFG